jgi:hypothetical protein
MLNLLVDYGTLTFNLEDRMCKYASYAIDFIPLLLPTSSPTPFGFNECSPFVLSYCHKCFHFFKKLIQFRWKFIHLDEKSMHLDENYKTYGWKITFVATQAAKKEVSSSIWLHPKYENKGWMVVKIGKWLGEWNMFNP